MTKTYKPSEINILNRQIVPTDKINISETELIEELRNRIQCDPFSLLITRLSNPLGHVSFSIHDIKPDGELFEEQYNEAEEERRRSHNLTDSDKRVMELGQKEKRTEEEDREFTSLVMKGYSKHIT